MSDVSIRIEGAAGRITLTRESALNALSHEMCLAIDAALIDWAQDPAVKVILIDALGEKAFCAGGDIVEMYHNGRAGNFDQARHFWRDEYRMNARIADYPKPIVAFLQGFTMGGGVGLGCHASHRVVGDTTQIAMPECAIGLVPDVGGSFILAGLNQLSPGLGSWIGTTGHRIKGARAIPGFATHHAPENTWPDLKARIIATGTIPLPEGESTAAPDPAPVARHFDKPDLASILAALTDDPSDEAQATLKTLSRADPLATACHLAILHRLTPQSTIRDALTLEYRFTYRCMEQGNFLEGIRAAVIDKDRSPKWPNPSLTSVTPQQVDAMLAPLGANDLTFPEDNT